MFVSVCMFVHVSVYVSVCMFACVSDCLFQAFIGTDVTFAMKPYFRGVFCSQDVREGLLVAFVRHILSTSQVSNFNKVMAINKQI